MTRVVVASRIYAPESAAAAFRLEALAHALVEGGAIVDVHTTTFPKVAAEVPGVQVFRRPVLRDRSGAVRGYLQYLSFDIPLFFRLLTGARPDVLVAEPPPTTGLVVRAAAMLRGRPYVYYAADVWSDAATAMAVPSVVRSLLTWVEKRALRGASLVLAVSEGVAERVASLAPNTPLKVVGNGVDTSIYQSIEALEEEPFAIYAGTASEWQGADIFIRALAQLRDEMPSAKMLFLGQGSEWHRLKDLASELDLPTVEFMESVSQGEAARIIGSARVGLVSLKPGQGYDFALPTKLFASLASGVPVLFAGPEGAARQLVERHQLGDAVPYSVEHVAEALREALSRAPATERKMQLAAWAEQNVSLRGVAERCVSAIKNILTK